jgi:hypothetical protein
LEVAPAAGGAAGLAEIAVEHHHLGAVPAEGDGRIGPRILAHGRLGVVPDLGRGRLAEVDQRQPVPALEREAHS